jgi:hypothetical protein
VTVHHVEVDGDDPETLQGVEFLGDPGEVAVEQRGRHKRARGGVPGF